MQHSYAIIGTGAVGGLYGARLQHAGHDVHFLVHSDYEHVRAHGLRVTSPWGHLTLPRVQAYARSRDMPACDVICVCLKTTQNHLLPALLAPLVRAGTVILLMQNGLGAEEEVAARFPQARVAGALCFLCCNKTGPGVIHHVDYGHMLLGMHGAGPDAALRRIAAEFTAAGIPNELKASLADARWRKLFWNIPFNGLSVVLQAETDAIMADASSRGLAQALLQEVLAGARACGCGIEDAFVRHIMDFTDKMKPYRTSMALDYAAGRALEIEYIYDRPLAAARQAGLAMLRVATLADELHFLDRRRRAAPAAPGA